MDREPQEALRRAIRLHDFIRTNAGPTDEWPLRISSTESGTIERLDALLKEFRKSVNNSKL